MSNQMELDKLLEIAKLRRDNRAEYDALMIEVEGIMNDMATMVMRLQDRF
jgi:hypothetical protein